MCIYMYAHTYTHSPHLHLKISVHKYLRTYVYLYVYIYSSLSFLLTPYTIIVNPMMEIQKFFSQKNPSKITKSHPCSHLISDSQSYKSSFERIYHCTYSWLIAGLLGVQEATHFSFLIKRKPSESSGRKHMFYSRLLKILSSQYCRESINTRPTFSSFSAFTNPCGWSPQSQKFDFFSVIAIPHLVYYIIRENLSVWLWKRTVMELFLLENILLFASVCFIFRSR